MKYLNPFYWFGAIITILVGMPLILIIEGLKRGSDDTIDIIVYFRDKIK